MKVVQTHPPCKEHLPIKYTQNIEYRFDFFELNQVVGLLRKNPLQKEEDFNKKM
jgi:hypothetical protein